MNLVNHDWHLEPVHSFIVQFTEAEVKAIRVVGIREYRRPYRGSKHWWCRLCLNENGYLTSDLPELRCVSDFLRQHRQRDSRLLVLATKLDLIIREANFATAKVLRDVRKLP